MSHLCASKVQSETSVDPSGVVVEQQHRWTLLSLIEYRSGKFVVFFF